MGDPTDPGPVVVDPELETALVRLLSIRGQLGSLKVLDTVVPVVNMGDVVQPTIAVRSPSFRSTDIFSNGLQTAQAAGTILADTGQLADGVFDVKLLLEARTNSAGGTIEVQHRNAANTATLAVWTHIAAAFGASGSPLQWSYDLGLQFALNERLRAVQVILAPALHDYAAVIMARLRT